MDDVTGVIQGRRIDSLTQSDSGGVTAAVCPCHTSERSTDKPAHFVSLSQHQIRDGVVGQMGGRAKRGCWWGTPTSARPSKVPEM